MGKNVADVEGKFNRRGELLAIQKDQSIR
jgi:hypothetical protein